MASYESIPKHHLRVSSYDRVSSWLVSSLVVAGVTVAALVFIYFHASITCGGFRCSGDAGQRGRRRHGWQSAIQPVQDRIWSRQELTKRRTLDEPQLQDTLSAVASAVAS